MCGDVLAAYLFMGAALCVHMFLLLVSETHRFRVRFGRFGLTSLSTSLLVSQPTTQVSLACRVFLVHDLMVSSTRVCIAL